MPIVEAPAGALSYNNIVLTLDSKDKEVLADNGAALKHLEHYLPR
ncbi:MAG: hypothetical protein WA364_13840 [Candidatus Nitrosopolaris sp.]